MTTSYEPSHLQQQINTFAARMDAVLEGVATHHHGVTGGHEWTWSTPAGPWAVVVGGAINPAPVLIGPGDNLWRTDMLALDDVDRFTLMLQLAGALPIRVGPRTVAKYDLVMEHSGPLRSRAEVVEKLTGLPLEEFDRRTADSLAAMRTELHGAPALGVKPNPGGLLPAPPYGRQQQ